MGEEDIVSVMIKNDCHPDQLPWDMITMIIFSSDAQKPKKKWEYSMRNEQGNMCHCHRDPIALPNGKILTNFQALSELSLKSVQVHLMGVV